MGATVSNTEIVRDLITHFFNEHDAGVAEQYSDDLKWHGGLVGDVEGVRPYADVMRGFFAALPDVHAVEQDALESGNTVSMRLVVEGTHEGELWGLPPSGRRLRWDAIMIYRMQDGKVIEQWAAEDWTAILHGVGDYTPPWLRT
ncbi:MAG: ester cyclase [Solirubrobacteraceae bacterium]